jgi:hypothetical protein
VDGIWKEIDGGVTLLNNIEPSFPRTPLPALLQLLLRVSTQRARASEREGARARERERERERERKRENVRATIRGGEQPLWAVGLRSLDPPLLSHPRPCPPPEQHHTSTTGAARRGSGRAAGCRWGRGWGFG